MRNVSTTALIVASGILAASVSSADGAITFLHHFNSNSSFDVTPANGDFAAGDSTATLSNSPTTDTGFFPSSTPANLAFKAGGTSPSYAEFNGYDGNINFTTPTTGGVTVGAWVKFSGAANPVGRILTLGWPDLDDDTLMVDYGNSNTDIPRAFFRDGGSIQTLTTGSAVNLSDWVYLAVAVDLGASQMNLYLYDNTGAAIGGTPLSTAITVSGWNLNNPLATGVRVRVGGAAAPGSTLWLDELSIDDEVLSGSTISARVASMVAGNQLEVPEPSAGFAFIAAGLAMARRHRRACR